MQVYNIHFDENKRETTHHGTLDFPLAIYTTEISKNILGFIDWHWHEEMQFCIVEEGCVEFHINHEKTILSKGEGLFINSKQLHFSKNANNTNGKYICFAFHENLISSFSGSLISKDYVHPYVGHQQLHYCLIDEAMIEKLKLIYHDYHQQDKDYLRIVSYMMLVWKDLITHYFSQIEMTQTIAENRCKQMIDYLMLHYDEAIKLEDIAQAIHLSQSECCREFKKNMGCTIFEYLMNYRLMKATELLEKDINNITEIALACGFNSSSYFIKHFKKRTGMTPLQYKKKQKKSSIKN